MQSSGSFFVVMFVCLPVLMGEDRDMDKLPNLSELQFPSVKMKIITPNT